MVRRVPGTAPHAVAVPEAVLGGASLGSGETAAGDSVDDTRDLRRLLGTSAWVTAGVIAWQGAAFLGLAVSARIATPADFGRLSAVIAAPMALSAFMSSAVGTAATRFVAAVVAKEDLRAQQRAVSTPLLVGTVAGVALGALAFFGAPVFAALLREPNATSHFRLASAIAPLSVVNGGMTGVLMALGRARGNALANLTGGALFLALVGPLVSTDGVAGGVAALLVGLSIVVLSTFFILRRSLKAIGLRATASPRHYHGEMLVQFIVPSAISNAVVAPAIWMASSFLARREGGIVGVGIFYGAYRVQTAISLVAYSIGQAVLPWLAAYQGERTRFRAAVNSRAAWIPGSALIASMLCLPGLWPLLYGDVMLGVDGRVTATLVLLAAAIPLFTDGIARNIAVESRMWLGVLGNGLWAALLLPLAYAFSSAGPVGLASAIVTAYALSMMFSLPIYLSSNLVDHAALLNASTLLGWVVLAGAAAAAILGLPGPVSALVLLAALGNAAREARSIATSGRRQ